MRRRLLHDLEDKLETPLLILGVIWLILLIVELISGLTPFFEAVSYVIWGIFVVDFIVKFSLAPAKLPFLKSHWLTMLSLLVPALRVFRFARVIRLLRLSRGLRGIRLFRVITSFRRSMASVGGLLGRRGFGYVVILTLIVVVLGAAGMVAFESEVDSPVAPKTFWSALWWTAMLVTTIGSEYWPQSVEGKLLTLILSIYSVAVFGYIAATIATYFIGQETQTTSSEAPTAHEQILYQINEMRKELESLKKHKWPQGD